MRTIKFIPTRVKPEPPFNGRSPLLGGFLFEANMAITKKLRFEVFKRDGFQCGYCGKQPPEAILEVDHIEPKSKGGKDDINNLITACFDCNRGKRDIPLSCASNKLVENLEILKEKELQIKEYRKEINKARRRLNKDIKDIADIYEKEFPEWSLSKKFKNISIKNFINKLPKHEVVEAMEIAVTYCEHEPEPAVKYFCGICWKKIKGES